MKSKINDQVHPVTKLFDLSELHKLPACTVCDICYRQQDSLHGSKITMDK